MANPVLQVQDVIEHVNKLMIEFPQLADDPDLLADTVEGETNLHRVVEKLVTAVRENDMQAEAIAARIGSLRERQTRATTRMNFYRSLIHRLLTATGQTTVATTEGKVSVVNAPERVIITDETAIPKEYQRIKTEPDKAEIKKALSAGKHISGATLSNGGTTIMIR